MSLIQKLKSHDWYYEYSDDGSVWRRGRTEQKSLIAELSEKNCKFTWWNIHRAINNYVVEDYIEDTDGTYYQQSWRDKKWNIYQPRRDELITKDEQSEIMKWLEENDAP